MKAQQLWFNKPFTAEVREQTLAAPAANEVLVRSLYSGISAGTELLAYRGQLPEHSEDDASLDSVGAGHSYPMQYGYACVGEIEQVGPEVDKFWLGQKVFSFQPHASHFVCPLTAVIPVPDAVDPRAAIFLANMETAVNLLLDTAPLLGEKVVVLGQGVLGLLATSLLAQFPLAALYAVDAVSQRRQQASSAGATSVFDADSAADIAALKTRLAGGADAVLELSGSPLAMNLAVDLCGYAGRIVVGSWYGSKRAEINLGERFHRNRMTIISSQVSTIAPALSGRWDKQRRFSEAWQMISKCQPEQFITHTFALAKASEAYQLLDSAAADALQVVFEYG